MAVSGALAAAGPWAVVTLVGFVSILLAFIVVVVRSAKSNMTVRIGKIIEIRRGARDSDHDKPQTRRLKSVDKPPREPDPRPGPPARDPR